MKRLPPIARILLAIAALTSSTSLSAHDVQVKSAAALDGKVKCFAHTSGWTANSTGPCHTFTPPAKLAVGERFVADGNERQIGVIVASARRTSPSCQPYSNRKGRRPMSEAQAIAYTANFATVTFKILIECLDKNGALRIGSITCCSPTS
jgi:hypothetical protein